MRYIILLVAISLCGQDSLTYRMKAPLKFKDAIEIKRDLEQLKELSDYYESYKRECYNDSAEVWDWPSVKLHNGATCDTLIYPAKVWKHKEPTFDGFMTWLRNILSGGKNDR